MCKREGVFLIVLDTTGRRRASEKSPRENGLRFDCKMSARLFKGYNDAFSERFYIQWVMHERRSNSTSPKELRDEQ